MWVNSLSDSGPVRAEGFERSAPNYELAVSIRDLGPKRCKGTEMPVFYAVPCFRYVVHKELKSAAFSYPSYPGKIHRFRCKRWPQDCPEKVQNSWP